MSFLDIIYICFCFVIYFYYLFALKGFKKLPASDERLREVIFFMFSYRRRYAFPSWLFIPDRHVKGAAQYLLEITGYIHTRRRDDKNIMRYFLEITLDRIG